MKNQEVYVIQQKCSAVCSEGYSPLLYEIYVDNSDITDISPESAKFIYEKLGEFLKPETV